MIGFSLQYHNIPEIIFLEPHGFLRFTEKKNTLENYKTTHSSGQTLLQDVAVYERLQTSLFIKNVLEYKVCGR